MQKSKQKIKFFVVWQKKTGGLSGKCLFLQYLNPIERCAYLCRKPMPVISKFRPKFYFPDKDWGHLAAFIRFLSALQVNAEPRQTKLHQPNTGRL
jgi:hypothetical protein